MGGDDQKKTMLLAFLLGNLNLLFVRDMETLCQFCYQFNVVLCHWVKIYRHNIFAQLLNHFIKLQVTTCDQDFQVKIKTFVCVKNCLSA